MKNLINLNFTIMAPFTLEQKYLLAKAQPITRKWLCEQFKNGKEITATLQNDFIVINTIETNIYKQWHQRCLAEMRRVKLNLSVPELYEEISIPKVTVTQALTLAQRYYNRKPNKTQQKHVAKIISLIKKLDDREKAFYQEATTRILTEKPHKVLPEVAQKLETMGALEAEYLLYTKQSIKHVNNLRRQGAEASVHELYQALDPQFATDNDLYQKQILIVLHTYHEGQDVPTGIKDVCFEFIKESIPHAGYIPGQLVDYIFFNDTISARAFQLFLDLETMAKEQGICAYIYAQAGKLARKLKLYDKQPADLDDAELRILKLEKIFKFQKQ